MLLRIGHKPRGGLPELTAVRSGKTMHILIYAARPCGGGLAAQDDGIPLKLRKR